MAAYLKSQHFPFNWPVCCFFFFKTNAVTRASKSNGMAREKTPLATEAPSDKRDRLTG